MALTGIFQKTAKGAAELSARTVKLAPMTRMALVMVDGVKAVPELAGKLGGDAAAEAALTELQGHGLIEAAGVVAPGGDAAALAAGAAPAVTAAAAATPAIGFEELRKWAAKHVSGAMGPMGDDYCLRIERAKTPADLDGAADKARNAIGGFTTRAKGEAFWSEYQANRGA